MKRIFVAILVISLGLSSVVFAAGKNGGLAASYATPDGEFEKVVGDGWGMSAIFDYPMSGMVNISGSLGYYSFAGATIIEGTNIELEGQSMWEFTAGPQIDFGRLYIGIEGGYYTDLNEWGAVPNIGIRKDMFDFSLRYKMTDDAKFYAARAGFYF